MLEVALAVIKLFTSFVWLDAWRESCETGGKPRILHETAVWLNYCFLQKQYRSRTSVRGIFQTCFEVDREDQLWKPALRT